MNDLLQGKRFLRDVGMTLTLALLLCGTALGQQTQVSGRVTSSPDGAPIQGVTVRIRGTTTSTLTDGEGRYSLAAPADGVLVFALIGYRGVGIAIGGRSTVDAAMDRAIAVLPEVVVTGYTTQRRADITGAISSVDVESALRQTSVSVLQRLDGRVPGVTVDANGSPGSRSTVRIRGVTSFQNNDPLYIIDGTPVDGTQDPYINWLNPNDIAEVQVLKDASAASIYGSRASNGVVIIETRKGRPGPRRVSLDVRTGVAAPVRGYDDFLILDALEYHEVIKRSYLNAGVVLDSIPAFVKAIYGDPANPTIPAYTYVGDTLAILGRDAWGRPVNVNTNLYAFPNRLIMPASRGTNWWDAVFSPAAFADANLSVSGGGADNAYSVSFNYLNQDGTAAYNRFQRGSVRISTTFSVGKVALGQNIALSRAQQYGGLPGDPGSQSLDSSASYAEDGIVGKNILMQPVVPVYDIAGNFASGKAVGLGNQSNPLKYAWARQFDRLTNDQIVGNVFAGLDLFKDLSFKTRFGFNLGQEAFKGFTPITPENSEPGTTNSINENDRRSTDWTWSNTLNLVRTSGRHNLAVLLGHEANQNTDRIIVGEMSGLINTDPSGRYIQDALGAATTKVVSSGGSIGKLLSFFGKADYNFAEKYYLSFTLRRDGSSRLGPSHRWATFPAFNLGWRLSQEPFLAGNQLFSNVMLRFGWGLTGNQRIPAGRIVSGFGGNRGDVFYDIGGTGTTVSTGFRQTSFGNLDLKWEENESVNAGLDLEFSQGKGNFVVDFYQRETDNLLFDPPNPATAGVVNPAIVNVGKMRNRGVDFSIGYNGTLGEGTLWSVNFNGSHYRNKIVRIDGEHDFFFGPIETRFGNQVINKVGEPIGSFYGRVADGYFQSQAEINQLNQMARDRTGDPAAEYQQGAAPGRIKFRDVTGDGRVTGADNAIIGSPHPDFTAGLDLALRWRSWDLSATLFGSFGNDIFDVQKEFYVFRNFSTNVRRDLLTDSYCLPGDEGCVTPNDPNAKYPRLDQNDAFSRQVSSYYIENGSYVRLRNLQIGYTVPPGWVRWIPAARIYVQAENLFTITGYPGLDPSLPAAYIFGPAGDIRDQYRGIDRGTYPSSRTFTLGISTTF
jgi:TonB-dependent starch-binding outer membrane protein SusC